MMLLVVLSMCLVEINAFAAQWNIKKITNNYNGDYFPRINNNDHIVWAGNDQTSIFLYENSIITQIASPGNLPDINDNNHMVWRAYSSTADTIVLYNGATATIIDSDSTPNYDLIYPRINNQGKVIWIKQGNYDDVYLFNGVSNQLIYHNSIYGQPADINNNGDIVWTSQSGDAIYKYDGTTGAISQPISSYYFSMYPKINDRGDIVFQHSSGDASYGVYLYKDSTITKIADGCSSGDNTDINNNGDIVWAGIDGQIYLYNGSLVTKITNSPERKSTPRINDNSVIIWFASDGHDSEIYQATFGEPPSNNPLVLNSIGDKQTHTEEALSFNVTATDSDGDNLSFILPVSSELPQGANFQITNNNPGYIEGVFTWIPTIDQAGDYQILFEVFDGNLSVLEKITIHVLYNPPDGWEIIRITNTSYNEYGVRIYENKLVWQGYPNSGSSEIFYYDGTDVHQLTSNNGTYNMFPKISSRGIVWAGNLPTFDSTAGDVCFYDFATGNTTILVNDCINKTGVDIYGDKIVWSNHADQQIILDDSNSITPIAGAYGLSPRISSGGVIFTNGPYNHNHLNLYDWHSVIDLGETTDSDAQQHNPTQMINGDKVAWFKNMGPYEANEVMVRDIPSGVNTQITNGNIQYGQPCQPVVNSQYVAWWDPGTAGPKILKLYDGQQILTIATSDWISNPYFGDGYLAWSMWKNGKPDLFVYYLDSKQIEQLTNDSFEESGIVASGKYLAYLSHMGGFPGQSEVYLAKVNQPPILNSIGNKEVNEGEMLEFTISATDPEGKPITYSVENQPSDADFNTQTGEFNWTPDYDQAGIYPGIKFIASDGALTDEEIITITVNNTNRGPIFNPINDKSVNEGVLLEFTISATDPDGDTVTYSSINLPQGASLEPQTGTFNWTPNYYQAGDYIITFIASDGDLSAGETITITVNNVNGPPVFDPIGDKTINRLKLLRFYVRAVDPDGDRVTYDISNKPQGAYFNKLTGMFIWRPRITQAGNFTVTFIAKDRTGNQTSETITIHVPNSPPILNPIGDRTVRRGQYLYFRVIAQDSDTIDRFRLSYYAQGLPRGAHFSRAGIFIWRPNFSQKGTYNVKFYVKDPPGAMDEEIIIITVN
jgi:hypothetical protein